MQHIETTGISRRNLLRSGALFGAGALLSGSAMAHAATAAAKLRWSNVAGLIDSYVAQRRVANMVAAIGMGQRPASFLDNGVLTLGRMQQAGPDSLYRIYSMTKPVTGMAAMMLIEEGKLALDQPVSDILPKFSEMQVQRTYDGSLTDLEPAKRPITIRHLLTHTAGLGYSIIQKGPIKAAYEAAGLLPGQVTRLPLDQLFGSGKPVDSLEKFADRLAAMPLVYQPGTRWSYSVGLDLLGRVIEVVSGQPFDSFLQERFFGPLGMTSTFFRVPQSEAHRLTTNYGVLGKTIIPIDPARRSIFLDPPAFPFGGAGLVSSPRDYDRFLRMLGGYGKFNDIRIMGEEAVRIGTSNLLPEGVPPTTGFIKVEAFGAGGVVGTGSRKGTFGWGGAAGTTAFVDMRTGLRAGLYTQFMPAEAYPVSSDFLNALQQDIAAMQGV